MFTGSVTCWKEEKYSISMTPNELMIFMVNSCYVWEISALFLFPGYKTKIDKLPKETKQCSLVKRSIWNLDLRLSNSQWEFILFINYIHTHNHMDVIFICEEVGKKSGRE